MSSHPLAQTIEARGCTIELRCVEGPIAREIFFAGRPTGEAAPSARAQAEAIYDALRAVLEGAGGPFPTIVSETVYLRSLAADLEPVRDARAVAFGERDALGGCPARAAIEQAPLREGAHVEIAGQALAPRDGDLLVECTATGAGGANAARAPSRALGFRLGDERHLRVAGLCGRGAGARAQALDLFERAEGLLRREGLDFGDVVRTWLHCRDIDRDYAELNRARRTFFAARGIDPPPASTGIGGGPALAASDLGLTVHALASARPRPRTVMHSPTLNEAWEYGADFVRGLRVAEANKVSLHLSGTASIDERGRTAHAGDLDAQVDRMLRNVSALLEGQGAGLRDVVSAVTYLRDPADAARLQARLRAAGFTGFPNVLVAAPICRPDLLCETEVLAVLPAVDA